MVDLYQLVAASFPETITAVRTNRTRTSEVLGPAALPQSQRVVALRLGGGVPHQEGAVGRVSELLVHILPVDTRPEGSDRF